MKKIMNGNHSQELVFGITTRNGYYAPTASIGYQYYYAAGEHDWSERTHFKLRVSKVVPDGCYEFYIPARKCPIALYLSGGEVEIRAMATHHWRNSQVWWWQEIKELDIQPNWIFVDGQDVYPSTKETIKEKKEKKNAERKSAFEELSQIVQQKYGDGILKLATKKKGQVLATLSVLANNRYNVSQNETEKILELREDAEVVENLLAIVAADVNPYKAAKVAEKAYAWAYLNNAFPSIEFTGCFYDAQHALELYSKHWGCIKNTSKNTLGDFFRNSGINL